MKTTATPMDTRSEHLRRPDFSGAAAVGVGSRESARFSLVFPFGVYNKRQLSLTHKQLKVGIANQRHPLTSSESSQHNPKKQE
jgi:hypothetical protein